MMNDYMKSYILHYSNLHDKSVSEIVNSRVLPSESEAKKIVILY